MSLFIGGQSVSSVTTRALDDDGDESWTAKNVVTVICIAANSSHVVTGGQVTSSKTTRKYDIQTGAEITSGWPVNHGATVRGIAIDDDGNVYTGGDRVSSVTTRKYNSAGTLQWSVDHGAAVYAIAVDSSGNVYTAGVSVSGFPYISIRRYDSSGTQTLSQNHGATTRAIIVDSSGNIYIGGVRSVDTGYYSVRKYNSSGTLQWSSGVGTSNAWALVLDGDEDFLYVGTNNPSSEPYKNIFKLNVSDGSEITAGWPIAHGEGSAIVDALAWRFVVPPAIAPGLPFPLSLGLPSAFGGHSAPGLPFPFSLGLPSASDPPLPPELAGLPVARVYRAWLTGVGSDPLALPGASLQCTRRRNDSTWISLSLPTYSSALAATLNARIGGQIVIDAGYRLADGSETTGLFLRATLTAAEYEYTRDGASITLTARVIPTASTPQSRTLYGIRSQTQDNGRYTVICEPDPLIRPGDTVAADGASFVVHSAQYRISPQDGEMTVVEVA